MIASWALPVHKLCIKFSCDIISGASFIVASVYDKDKVSTENSKYDCKHLTDTNEVGS